MPAAHPPVPEVYLPGPAAPVPVFADLGSQYALEAIEKYGAVKGGWLAFKRLLRCNPFYKGDYFDPVP